MTSYGPLDLHRNVIWLLLKYQMVWWNITWRLEWNHSQAKFQLSHNIIPQGVYDIKSTPKIGCFVPHIFTKGKSTKLSNNILLTMHLNVNMVIKCNTFRKEKKVYVGLQICIFGEFMFGSVVQYRVRYIRIIHLCHNTKKRWFEIDGGVYFRWWLHNTAPGAHKVQWLKQLNCIIIKHYK